MATRISPPAPTRSAEPSGSVLPGGDPSQPPGSAEGRTALLHDLVRALARGAAREAWALACPATTHTQEVTS